MLVVHVMIQVKPDQLDAFIAATIDNATHSRQEAGIARFDFVQEQADPTRFVLVEVYRHDGAPAAHKETAHYQRWRETVAPMMAAPRQSTKYANIDPTDDAW